MCIGLRNSHKNHRFSHYVKPYIRIFSTINLLMTYDFENDVLPESVGHPFEFAKLVELRSQVGGEDVDWEAERSRLPNESRLSTFTGAGKFHRGSRLIFCRCTDSAR